ncbi:hypothetical protein [Pandoraea apista]|uniref:Uncharacterized protein n=1 Tax=Pandoraea apista TaxID=93218 RepID=A0ABX9ZJQ4_9BURK|nr:hypothetical protein [Pandoraea apista]RRJ27638.1 hypothetical protein EIB05_21130 [Pandoraea apista]RRJ73088.1 hypothetical protein EIL82_22280 [Pandoraea apista]RSD06592.1 hypothetical protein EJB12_20900 [Pandoraea apista]RSD10104.1 hypothetical protein EIZ52_22575 [Pandoraea apista]RSK76026.1 hypothetical protein EJE83_21900 [Pandoraea apista]
MKELFFAMAVAAALFSPAAYSQQSVLSCVVKTASGSAKTRAVAEIRVGSSLDIPVESLKANGSNYNGRDIFNTERNGERTVITINRETGEFEFSASSYGVEDTHKRATGDCKIKKMKL